MTAQTPAPRAPAHPAPSVSAVSGAAVTVEGCVTRESALPHTAADAREPSAALRYVLTEHTPPAPLVPDASPSDRAPTVAPPPAGQKPGRRMYVLVSATDALDFAPHLNHIVRVTGAATAPPTEPPPATAPSPGRSPEATPVAVPTLAVATVEMVSPTCR
jgi:hypothetical protein